MTRVIDIADFLEAPIRGDPETEVVNMASVEAAQPGDLSWLAKGRVVPDTWNGSVLIWAGSTALRMPKHQAALIRVTDPRLAFARVYTHFFKRFYRADLPVEGANITIDETARIGVAGQGFVWDGDRYIRFPQIGGLVIGDNVSIGPLSTIMRGSLDDTVIGEGTKIGNGVNIGHGVSIGKHCLIVAHATIGGSAKLGNRVTIWQGAMIANNVEIGDHAVIGMGAVVLSDVPSRETWVGNPARRTSACSLYYESILKSVLTDTLINKFRVAARVSKRPRCLFINRLVILMKVNKDLIHALVTVRGSQSRSPRL